jgi:hypothetical protein
MVTHYGPDRNVFFHRIDSQAMRNLNKQIPHLLAQERQNLDGRNQREKREVPRQRH